jgi:PTH1 family peptidyl-tRNA hydrolase
LKSGTGIRLIVGLGNPGAEYEHTRHNAGAWFVNELAQTNHVDMRHENKYRGFHASTQLNGQECHLLIPSTYMNLSGHSVVSLATYFKIPPEAILVAHDEIDIPVGNIRLKFDGGHGGHNGLRDIIQHLHTKQFHRLRIGVGRPQTKEDVVDYVLHAPKKAERQLIDENISKALGILPYVLEGQFQKAMHLLHTTD